MAEDTKGSTIIPTLLTGAALYFGFGKKSNTLGDLTREAVTRVIEDQTGNNSQQKKPRKANVGQLKKPRKKRAPNKKQTSEVK